MRCPNGTREQSSNTVTLDEKNRAKLVKDKPARPEEGQLGEEKIGSGDLAKLDAYERDEASGRKISVTSLTSLRKACDELKDKGRKVQCQKTFNGYNFVSNGQIYKAAIYIKSRAQEKWMRAQERQQKNSEVKRVLCESFKEQSSDRRSYSRGLSDRVAAGAAVIKVFQWNILVAEEGQT
ncbi:translation initiation factor IF-2, chloroplastic-like [Dorcoceras hygrometricum]|uniref:Translation initiation factor IF-2, chloroplastic-like n=1 Tax=Dorcoceras hygrometricum TaxID=472368 RepID=A0A2Z7BMQ0_9LAMI|nr:translation initiation factor IF-2, chloroplastic-like [Dorcoceras hygrometricum]